MIRCSNVKGFPCPGDRWTIGSLQSDSSFSLSQHAGRLRRQRRIKIRSKETKATPLLVLQPVAHAMHGENMHGLIGLGFDFFTQLRDVLVERSGRAIVVHAPRAIEQVIPGNHLPRMQGQNFQHPHLSALRCRQQRPRQTPPAGAEAREYARPTDVAKTAFSHSRPRPI